jgi:multicomponent Na+:H+ antiporter subunit D
MKLLVVAPVLVPLAAAALGFLAWKSRAAQRAIGVVGAAALLALALILLVAVDRRGMQAVQIGGWPAPFGITWVADRFGCIMVVLAGLIGLATVAYSLLSVDASRESFAYYPLIHVLLGGVCGAFLTGDLFNLFVWFEVMLIASFVLLALGGERPQLEGAIKYVTLNLIASALFLSAVGLLYGMTGALNMAQLSVHVREEGTSARFSAISLLFVIAFGIKAAVFPLFFWLPASYATPPVAVSALFAGLLTKVGVYALIRVFTLIFVGEPGFTHAILLGISILTMVTGVLGALAQGDVRRILSFHIVSQIGYMILGLGLFTPLALAGSVFYIAHHVVVKTNLFLVSGLAERASGSGELRAMGGLFGSHPGMAVLFLISALSLAGVPPLSGFFAKLLLVRAGLEVGATLAVGFSLLVSLLTLLSMTKIWSEAFWKPSPEGRPGALRGGFFAPAAGLACVTLALGLAGRPFLDLSIRAAEDLMDPARYVRTVLGG